MVRLAVAGHPAFEVSEIETKRPGPHYSVETLEAIRRERPTDELFFLIGGDSLVDLPQWREPEKILRMATLVVANRPGFEPTVPEIPPGARPIRLVTIPPIGLASHEIRRLRREGRSIRYQVPRAVEAYIDAHGLYPPGPDPVTSIGKGG
jgi:nicotinate-nucleotide adenylyltransferase